MKFSNVLAAAAALAVGVHATPDELVSAENPPINLQLGSQATPNATCLPETLATSIFKIPEGGNQTGTCSEFMDTCNSMGDGNATFMSTSCGFNQMQPLLIEGGCIQSQSHGKAFTYARAVGLNMTLPLAYSSKGIEGQCNSFTTGWCTNTTYNAEALELCVLGKVGKESCGV